MINKFKPYKLVAKNTFYLTIMEVVQVIMPFIALPYIIKTIGSNNYGKVVFAQSISLYFFYFVNFGLEFIGAKEISIHRDNKIKCGRVLGTVLTIKVILCLIGLCIFGTLILLWSKTNCDPLVYFFSYGTCVSDIVFLNWLYQGLEKMFMITIIKSSSIIIYVCLIFIFLHQRNDYHLVPLFQSSSLIITSVISFIYLFKHEKIIPIFPSWKRMWIYLVNSYTFFLSRISVVFNNTIANIFIGITIGDYYVAVYDFAMKIIKTSLIPFSMVNQAVYPHNVRHKDLRFSTRILFGLIACATIGAVSLYFISPYLVKYLSKGELMDSVSLIRIMFMYLIVSTAGMYLGTPTLVAWGFSKYFNSSVIFSSIFLSFIYILFYFLHIKSLYLYCTSALASELFILIYRSYFCIKKIVIPYNNATIINRT